MHGLLRRGTLLLHELAAGDDNATTAQNFMLANGFTPSGNITLYPNRRTGSNKTKTFDVSSLTLGGEAAVSMAGDNLCRKRKSRGSKKPCL